LQERQDGERWFFGLKTLFFCNLKLTNLKLKTSSLTAPQRHGEFSEH
jgi:hypothetical protein